MKFDLELLYHCTQIPNQIMRLRKQICAKMFTHNSSGELRKFQHHER